MRRMTRRQRWFLVCGGLVLTTLLSSAEEGRGECVPERGATGGADAFVLHLGSSCSQAEREARAVTAGELMQALKQGKGVDLSGVVVRGDLYLDELPVTKPDAIRNLSPEDRAVLEALKGEELHVINGPFILRRSHVQGRIVNRLKGGYLVVTGPVLFAGTSFDGPLDLSRTVFLGLVDGSQARFDQESFFVQGRFMHGAMFSDTRFGPHARFHRSVFNGPAEFRRADFAGLTELLEVVFDRDADFSKATFRMGTGFSGAHCRGTCNFSGAQFQREAFFLFTTFDRSPTFAEARFESVADFSDSVFKASDDLASATFVQPPSLAKATRVTATKPASTGRAPFSQAVTVGLLVVVLGLLVYIVKAK